MKKRYKRAILFAVIVVAISISLQKTLKSDAQKFIDSVAESAQKIYQEGGPLPSITIAQAILESNWGKSELAEKAHNLFGIKGTYDGRFISMATGEYKHGKDLQLEKADFRAYPSIYESIRDHTRLFQEGTSWNKQQYKEVLAAKNSSQAAKALQKAHYSTDPYYANKLLSLIHQYRLDHYNKARS